MTEDELVAAIRGVVEAPPSQRASAPRPILVGIGDDAAVWRPSRSHLSVITTDALIDGVHFLSDAMDARSIGHRAMAANLSDVAAMGGRPVLATVALGVAPPADEAWLLECYRGMAALAAAHGARIVGGDIVRATAITLALTVVGEVSPSRLRRRDGGRPGDIVAVTGLLGGSRAGLELVRRPLEVPGAVRAAALARFLTPPPRVAEGRWLAASVNVRAMMDSSDGLSTDLARLAKASGCGATVETVPVDPAAEAVARAAGADPVAYALDGGEDFELIVAVGRRAFPYLAGRFERHFGRPLLRVGELEAQPGLRLREAAAERELVSAGWDHLR
ncbi:MAG: thiamine-phosphate kinase [Vulcanimicrobiaceae bacterium]